MSTPEQRPVKAQRILACIACQQRKIKCSRKFPCSSCVKNGVQCVPAATVPRQRRRRFAERELLDRLRKYEDLLRANNIDFEPLHPSSGTTDTKSPAHGELAKGRAGPAATSSPDASNASDTVFETKSFWKVMNQIEDWSGDSDDEDDGIDFPGAQLRRSTVMNTWELWDSGDELLFGWTRSDIPLASLHPEQLQVFKLWQTYLQNVNPLLKVTHSPSLQPRIIDAAGDLANISPALEALMFSIYCTAVHTLTEAECLSTFSCPKGDLLKTYQTGCQQALLNCKFLRTRDRECLTALYLYLVSLFSLQARADPRSLATMSGAMIRIAQRLGIHEEAVNAKCQPFEGEMRRRLWWSMVAFDGRVAELGQIRDTFLGPTWECALPLNVDDSDLSPQMKLPPTVHGKSTDALFAVARAELHQYIRHSTAYLDFKNPVLKIAVRPFHSDANSAQQTIEERYLQYCNPENPVHFMAMWAIRVQLAKQRLVEHYAVHAGSSIPVSDAERDQAAEHCMEMLSSDSQLCKSPLVTGFDWFMQNYFPLPAYIHIVSDLRRRPLMKHASKAWDVLDENFTSRFRDIPSVLLPVLTLMGRPILQAWAASEPVLHREPLLIVKYMQGLLDSTKTVPDAEPDMRIDLDMSLEAENPTPQNQDPLGFEPVIFGEQDIQLDMGDMGLSGLDWTYMHEYKW